MLHVENSQVRDIIVARLEQPTRVGRKNEIKSILEVFIHSIIAAFTGSLTWVTTEHIGSALAAMFSIFGALLGLTLSVIYCRNLDVLASSTSSDSAERQAYNKLRDSLYRGWPVTSLYARWLATFISKADRFFGDEHLGDRILIRTAFGLKMPAPLWTAPAFDRCLVVALVYPIITIIIIWTASGHIGPAETALHLLPGFAGWQRGLSALAAFVQMYAQWRLFQAWRTKLSREARLWFALSVISFVPLFASGQISLTFAACVAGVLLIGVFTPLAGLGAPSLLLAISLPAIAAGVSARPVTTLAFDSIAIAFFVLSLGANRITNKQNQGVYLFVVYLILIGVCPVGAYILAWCGRIENSGGLLMFLGLFTLINAPFDWASVGITRGLLRRGLELGGWWPFTLALLDAFLAAIVIVFLVIVMVMAVQGFNEASIYGGANPVLPLQTLLDGIGTHPEAPEYWWSYALVLSTAIPSATNLMIGGVSLMRGVPGLSPFLLRFMPAEQPVLHFEQGWLALVLTLQTVGGALLGVTVQALMIVGVVNYILPWMGIGLLKVARDVAAMNVPMQAWHLLVGS